MNIVYVPFVKPFPLKTLYKRLKWKFNFLTKSIIFFFTLPRYVTNFKHLYEAFNVISLVPSKFLPPAPEISFSSIFLVKDQGLSQSFKKHGSWEYLESYLSAEIIKKLSVNLLVDLGSNHGLWAIQTVKQLKRGNYQLPMLITVEPDTLLSGLLHLNLLSVGENPHLIHQHYNFALVNRVKIKNVSNPFSTIEFFRDLRNSGHQTSNESLVPSKFISKREVSALQSQDFFLDLERRFHTSVLFIKSDLQGSDADVLAAASFEFWSLVAGFQIEIWPIGQPELNIKKLLSIWESNFELFLMTENDLSCVKADEIFDYWTSNTLIGSTFGSYKTLFGFKKGQESQFFLNAFNKI